MSNNKLMNDAKLAALIMKKNKPTILTFAGIIGMVGASVWACNSTLKASKNLEDFNEGITELKADFEGNSGEWTDNDYKRALTKSYVNEVTDMIKLYSGPVILGSISIAMILKGEKDHRTKYAGVCAAYSTLDTMFKTYRKNVVERFDEQTDKELRYGIKKKKVEVEETDENGKTKKVKKEIAVATNPLDCISDYARFYDESCREWDPNPEYNLTKLRLSERQANDILKSRGYIYLNEVYDMLGIPQTSAGQRVGWFRGFGDNIDGDGYVDFGLYDVNREKIRDFVNGYEAVALLDFNVDGIIDTKVEEYEARLAKMRSENRHWYDHPWLE